MPHMDRPSCNWRPMLRCALGAVVLVVAGCGSAPEPAGVPAPDPGPVPITYIGREGDPKDGCGDKDLFDKPCPEPPKSWTVSRLFASLKSRPPSLARYCQYAYMPTGDDAIDEAAKDALKEKLKGRITLDAKPNLAIAQSFATEDELSQSVRQDMLDHFMDAARDFAPGGGVSDWSAVQPKKPVHIAVLDSSPDGALDEIKPGTLPHGYVMAWLARRLACGTQLEGCPVHVRPYLALDQDDEGHFNPMGGRIGNRGHLARTIVRAVDDAPEDVRLILLLAVGWLPSAGHANEVASQAVKDALDYAYSRGAMVFAAAGNFTAGEVGRVLPAAWEFELPQTCPDQAVDGGVPVDPAPLLTSVAGVDYFGNPIDVSRPLSFSALTALAFQATAEVPDDARLFPPHTGSSVAAMVASAAAALVWAFEPGDQRANVLTTLVDNGRAVRSIDSSFKIPLPGSGAEVPVGLDGVQAYPRQRLPEQPMQVSLCRAVATVLDKPGGVACRTPAPYESNPPWSPRTMEALAPFIANGPLPYMTDPIRLAPYERTKDNSQGMSVPVWPLPMSSGCSRCGHWNNGVPEARSGGTQILLAHDGDQSLRTNAVKDAIVGNSDGSSNLNVRSASTAADAQANGALVHQAEGALVDQAEGADTVIMRPLTPADVSVPDPLPVSMATKARTLLWLDSPVLVASEFTITVHPNGADPIHFLLNHSRWADVAAGKPVYVELPPDTLRARSAVLSWFGADNKAYMVPIAILDALRKPVYTGGGGILSKPETPNPERLPVQVNPWEFVPRGAAINGTTGYLQNDPHGQAKR